MMRPESQESTVTEEVIYYNSQREDTPGHTIPQGGHPGTHHMGQEEEGRRRKHGPEILLRVLPNKQSSTSRSTGWFQLFQWALEQRGLPGT